MTPSTKNPEMVPRTPEVHSASRNHLWRTFANESTAVLANPAGRNYYGGLNGSRGHDGPEPVRWRDLLLFVQQTKQLKSFRAD